MLNNMLSFMKLSERIVSSLYGALGIGYIILFNTIGIISIALQFMIFQMKKRKQILIVGIASNIGWLSYFVLQGDFISGTANIIGIMSNIIFLFRGKYRWADSRWWLAFFLIVAGVFSLATFKGWIDIFAFIASISATVAFFMLKENNIRKISLFTYCAYACNSISKLYIVALIADITALVSVVVSLIRYKKKDLPYPLIISDFDGTLVDNKGVVSQENKDAINKYCNDGGIFVISTGRMHYEILPEMQELGLNGLVSCGHGSLIMDIKTKKRILEGTISVDVTALICKKMEELDLPFFVYAKDEFYVNMRDENIIEYEREVRVQARLVSDKPLSQYVLENGIRAYRITALVDAKETMSIIESLSKYQFSGCVLTKSGDTLVEVISAMYSKGTALGFLAEYFQIPLEKVIAVGDQWNDIPMIEKAGLGFAVKNADEKLKERARMINYTNEESAVAKIIEQYVYCNN